MKYNYFSYRIRHTWNNQTLEEVLMRQSEDPRKACPKSIEEVWILSWVQVLDHLASPELREESRSHQACMILHLLFLYRRKKAFRVKVQLVKLLERESGSQIWCIYQTTSLEHASSMGILWREQSHLWQEKTLQILSTWTWWVLWDRADPWQIKARRVESRCK